MSYKQQTLLLIIIATVLRIIVAGSVELGNDEVYYITYAQKIQWNYFDHPPLVGLLIKITSLDLLLTNEIFIRLGPILLASLDTWLIFLITRRISNEKAAFLASLFFTASPYTSIITGLFIMPDAPMMTFWIIGIYLLVLIFDKNAKSSGRNINLLLFGLVSGLSIMGKVHAVFLWAGMGLYILLFERKMLRSPFVYLAAVVTAIVISPIYFWNAANDFITYKFQGSRVTVDSGFKIDSLLTELFGGMFYNNPVSYILMIIAITALFRHRKLQISHYSKLLLCLSLPMIGILLFISCFRSTLPHWSGPAFMVLSILAAIILTEINFTKYKKILFIANLLLLSIVITAVAGINYYPGTLGNKNSEKLGEDDLTLEMYGWKKFNRDFSILRKQDISSGKMKENSFLLTHKWFPGGHLNFYVALPDKITLTGLGRLNDLHHFQWLNEIRPKLKKGDDAYIISPSNLKYSLDMQEQYGAAFDSIEPAEIINQYRSGKLVRYFEVYRAHGFKQSPDYPY